MSRPAASEAPATPLRARVRTAPSGGYCTVVFYGGSVPSPAKVAASAGAVAVGDYVRIEMQGRRPVITGKV